MARPNKKKLIGVVLCLTAIVLGAVAWTWAKSSGETSTDNAFVRGDITSLAPKVGGYVTAVEVEDNQTVRAGDVLFRIDDRDYRARLAQAEANVEAARARLANTDADTTLQRATIRQATAQRQAALAELNLATKASDRRRELIRSSAVSQAQVDESDAARIVGLLIVCCSAVALGRYGAWAEWSNIALGCWAIAAPFALGFGAAQAAMWTHVLIGICVAAIATVQLMSSRRSQGITHDRPAHGR